MDIPFRYGQQFKVHTYLECRPKDSTVLATKSGLIEGIGEVVAEVCGAFQKIHLIFWIITLTALLRFTA